MPKQILVVDDSGDMRDLLHIFLDGAKYRLVDATEGAQALTLLGQHDIGAVICDLHMPGMNGYALLKAVRADPKYQALPFLILTGSNDSNEKQQCLSAGADAWITKPFSPSAIRAELERLCPDPA